MYSCQKWKENYTALVSETVNSIYSCIMYWCQTWVTTMHSCLTFSSPMGTVIPGLQPSDVRWMMGLPLIDIVTSPTLARRPFGCAVMGSRGSNLGVTSGVSQPEPWWPWKAGVSMAAFCRVLRSVRPPAARMLCEARLCTGGLPPRDAYNKVAIVLLYCWCSKDTVYM